MELTMKIMKNRLLKFMICIILCLATLTLTFICDYTEAQAFFPALVLGGIVIPEAVQIVSALLVAAGLTWAANTAADATADWFYSSCAPVIRDGINTMVNTAANGVATVAADVWDATKTFVNTNFSVGEQTVTRHYYDATVNTTYGTDMVTNKLPANYNVPITEVPVGLPQTFTIGNDTYEVSITPSVGTNVYIRLKKNGVIMNNCTSIGVNTAIPWYVYLESYDLYGTIKFRFRVRRASYNETSWNSTDSTWPSVDNAVGAEALPGSPDIAVTGQNVVDNPDWDIADLETGVRKIAYPETVDEIVGKTYTDVTNVEDSTTPTGSDVTSSWLEGLLDGLIGGITGLLNNIWQWLQSFWNTLTTTLTGVLSPTISAIQSVTSAIQSMAATQEATAEADMTGQLRTYKIPDLFILILKVILACIRLIMRALVFIATLPLIPASAGNINSNFLSGVNFLKDQSIPYFGISLWSMATGVVAIFFGLAVVRRVRRLYSV